MSITDKLLSVEMFDGSKWGVPVGIIARDRAGHYAHEFGGDIEQSLAEDTIPLFENSHYDIEDWAVNNMNWSDVSDYAVKISDAPAPAFQEAWMNGEKAIVDKP